MMLTKKILITLVAACLFMSVAFMPVAHAEDKAVPATKAPAEKAVEKKSEPAKTEAKAETKPEAKAEAKTDAKPAISASSPAGVAPTAFAPPTEAEVIQARILLNQKLPYDITFGKEDAPTSMTEYASLSCPHCKAFYTEVFDKLKQNYIDTGRVKFVFRNYPLNLPALRAAMILECGVPADKRTMFLGAIFKAQDEWAYKEKEEEVVEKLKSIAKLGGLDNSKFDACAKDKALEDGMLRQQLQAQKALGVNSTPTLYINDKKYFDKKEYEVLAKAIDDVFKGAGDEDKSDKKADKPADKKDEPKAEDKKAEPKAAEKPADKSDKPADKKDEGKDAKDKH